MSLLLFVVLAASSSASGATFNLTRPHGEFYSSNYPAPYGNNVNDSWIISAQEGYRIVLYFTSFDLEDSFLHGVACTQDYVEISFEDDDGEPIRFCGNPKNFSDDGPELYSQKIKSPRNRMKIHMISDYSNYFSGGIEKSFGGFSAFYYSEDRDECEEQRQALKSSHDITTTQACDQYCNNFAGGFSCSCRRGYRLDESGYICIGDCSDIALFDSSGVIESPGYPKPYPKKTDCSWKIKANSGMRIQIRFETDFSIEDYPGGMCPFDYLKILDSSGQVGSSFCGPYPPFNGSTIQSRTNYFQIIFHSDDLLEKNGFRLYYQSRSILCERPSAPKYGRISHVTMNGEELETNGDQIPFSALIHFSCDDGFRLMGSGKIACLKDGSLSDYPPRCIPF